MLQCAGEVEDNIATEINILDGQLPKGLKMDPPKKEALSFFGRFGTGQNKHVVPLSVSITEKWPPCSTELNMHSLILVEAM